MGSNLVIVALPADDDPVWKISSEDKPHMTMLFLGDAESNPNVERIVEFVQHAADVSEHGPFYMDIDYRGELGPDKADVLFFRKGWSAKWITQLRGQLLQNTDIKAAYNSVEQYPEWTPHLTLGYPTAPAHDDEMPEHGLHGVRFDRIAVWVQDFDGPEIRLDWPEFDDMAEVAWSAERERGLQFAHTMGLEHQGVKGMKWGVRKERVAGGSGNAHIRVGKRISAVSNRSQVMLVAVGPLAFASPRFRAEVKAAGASNRARKAEKKAAKQDLKWEKKIYTTDGAVKVHNAMADHFNARIDAINNKPEYKNLDLINHPDNDVAKTYMKDVNALTMQGYRQAVQSVHGASPSGKKQAVLSDDGESVKIIDASKIKHSMHDGEEVAFLSHAEGDDEEITFLLKRDDQDRILEMNKADLVAAVHATDLVSEILAHHGVNLAETKASAITPEKFVDSLMHFGIKGMRWGVRRDRPAPTASTPVVTSKVPHGEKKKTKLNVQGGANHPAHEDAIKVAEAKAKLQKSGVHALSNKELRDLRERIQLEEQVHGLMTSRGRKFVRNQLQNEGQNLARQGARAGAKKGAKKIGPHVARRAAVVGATAALI